MTHTNTQPEALRLAEMYTDTPVVPQGWPLVRQDVLMAEAKAKKEGERQ